MQVGQKINFDCGNNENSRLLFIQQLNIFENGKFSNWIGLVFIYSCEIETSYVSQLQGYITTLHADRTAVGFLWQTDLFKNFVRKQPWLMGQRTGICCSVMNTRWAQKLLCLQSERFRSEILLGHHSSQVSSGLHHWAGLRELVQNAESGQCSFAMNNELSFVSDPGGLGFLPASIGRWAALPVSKMQCFSMLALEIWAFVWSQAEGTKEAQNLLSMRLFASSVSWPPLSRRRALEGSREERFYCEETLLLLKFCTWQISGRWIQILVLPVETQTESVRHSSLPLTILVKF